MTNLTMRTISLEQLQKLGGTILSDGRLHFNNTIYVKACSLSAQSQQLLASILEKYEECQIEYLLVDADDTATLWRAEGVIYPVAKPKIAHVEDSPVEGMIMEKILTDLGLPCVRISNPLLAVTTLLKVKPDFVFLDLHMPIVNGYEICAQLRRVQDLQHIPIVILTSSDGLVDRVRARICGATDFMNKPIKLQLVQKMIEKHLQPVSVF
ncbi:MAG: response regulator [Pseudanabaenaceae cyanobacterium SKYGB_i_bin29]|nr:response regulator [Pseudanabaenaceae cyanobacterium SKYG29]MDW8421854.1 response regulator [Pseudanabaenaceae cyanobacterium SKYGB_i_bin29]